MAFPIQKQCSRHGKEKAILLVGHNPSMTEFLVGMLAGRDSAGFVDFKKGAVAKVERLDRQTAVLKWCLTPKVVRALQQASAKSSRPKTSSK